MGTTITTPADITGRENLEEVYFLVRVGSWHQEHLAAYMDAREAIGYESGHADGVDYAENRNGIGWEAEYDRGYQAGITEGEDQGYDQGYRDGYNDGVRDGGADDHRGVY
jgi:hypothetical protein